MVIIFCGIPGSGKTTIARLLAKRLQSFGSVRLFVSDKIKPPVYEKFFRLLEENSGKYDFLVFDGTFYKKSWRDKMVKLAKREKVVIFYLKCSLQEAIKRNKNRKPGIPERALHIIFRRMEAPEKPNLVLNTEKITPIKSVKKIIQYFTRQKTLKMAS